VGATSRRRNKTAAAQAEHPGAIDLEKKKKKRILKGRGRGGKARIRRFIGDHCYVQRKRKEEGYKLQIQQREEGGSPSRWQLNVTSKRKRS